MGFYAKLVAKKVEKVEKEVVLPKFEKRITSEEMAKVRERLFGKTSR